MMIYHVILVLNLLISFTVTSPFPRNSKEYVPDSDSISITSTSSKKTFQSPKKIIEPQGYTQILENAAYYIYNESPEPIEVELQKVDRNLRQKRYHININADEFPGLYYSGKHKNIRVLKTKTGYDFDVGMVVRSQGHGSVDEERIIFRKNNTHFYYFKSYADYLKISVGESAVVVGSVSDLSVGVTESQVNQQAVIRRVPRQTFESRLEVVVEEGATVLKVNDLEVRHNEQNHVKDKVVTDEVAKDEVAKDKVAKDEVVKDKVVKDKVAKDKVTKDEVVTEESYHKLKEEFVESNIPEQEPVNAAERFPENSPEEEEGEKDPQAEIVKVDQFKPDTKPDDQTEDPIPENIDIHSIQENVSSKSIKRPEKSIQKSDLTLILIILVPVVTVVFLSSFAIYLFSTRISRKRLAKEDQKKSEFKFHPNPLFSEPPISVSHIDDPK